MLIETVLQATREYYKIHPAGGCLHIVSDDGNIEDSCLDMCAGFAVEEKDLVALNLVDMWRALTYEQRQELYERSHEYAGWDGYYA